MKRDCISYRHSQLYGRHVFVDAEIAEELYGLLREQRFRAKFDYIVNRILYQNFIYYADGYVRLKEYKDLSEMRLFPNGQNSRIYCKEVAISNGNLYVVASKILCKKKSNSFEKKLDSFVKPLELYEYGFWTP
jgi:hypothetical protein